MTTPPAPRTAPASKLTAQHKLLITLQCGLFLPLMLTCLAPAVGMTALPAWFPLAAALTALACLFAMLCVAWRADTLRGGFVLAFAAAILALPLARYFQLI